MSKLTKTGSALGFVLGVSLLSSAVRAQDTSDLDALLGESVSTTASKSAQASTAVPALSINVTAEDLRRYGIRTLAEAYNFLTVGIISEDPLADPEVGSRGVLLSNDAGKHILLMIDGHVTNDQLNGASYHGQSAGLPLELIDHLEIMLGPGSVLYGSNAMLGVVNVVTKRANAYSGLHLIAETGLSPPVNQAQDPIAPMLDGKYLAGLGQSYRFGAGVGRTFHLFGEAAEVTGQVDYYAFNGPTMGWPLVSNDNSGPRAPFDLWGGETTSLSYYQRTPSAYVRVQRGDLQLTLHGLHNHASSPYSRAQELQKDFDDPESYTDRTYGGFDLSWSNVVSNAISVVARVYGDASRQSSQFRTSNIVGCLGSQFGGCIQDSQGHAQWLGSELRGTYDWLSDRSISSTLGVEGRVRSVGFQGGLRDFPTGAQALAFGHYQETQDSAAAYAQQLYAPIRRLSLNGGVRWDVDHQFGQRLSPRAAAVVDVWHGGTAKLIYSEAFRAPTAEELHLANPFQVLAAPTLTPEIARSAEAVIQQSFGSHRVVIGVFRTWWENMILRERLSQAELSAGQRAGLLDSSTLTVFQFRNVAEITNYGVNASYEGTAREGRLSFGANLTWGYARVQTPTGSRQMTVTPSIYGNARVSYDLGGRLPIVGLVTQASSRRLVDNAQDPGVLEQKAAPPKLVTRLTISGQVPRISDLQYRLSADYAFTPSNPYVTSVGGRDPNVTEIAPSNRATVLFGLQYNFK
jgi:outer membrane receptor for ferrienterochelin and colicins